MQGWPSDCLDEGDIYFEGGAAQGKASYEEKSVKSLGQRAIIRTPEIPAKG